MSNLDQLGKLIPSFEDEKSIVDKLPDALWLDVKKSISQNIRAEKLLSNFKAEKDSTEYKIWLIQIILYTCISQKNNTTKSSISLPKIDGKLSADFIKSIKYIYPLYTKLTEYSIRKLLQNMQPSASKTIDSSSLIKPTSVKINNEIKTDDVAAFYEEIDGDDDSGIDKIPKNSRHDIYDNISNNKWAKDMLISFLGKNTIDLNSTKDKTALLQIYIIWIDNAKRKIESAAGKYAYTQYYKEHKLSKPTWLFDSNTIYMLNYILPNFDNTLSTGDVTSFLSSQNKAFFDKSVFSVAKSLGKVIAEDVDKTPEKKPISNISKAQKKEILTKDRTYFTTKTSKALIIDYLDEPVFLRCYDYMMKVLKFDEATTAAICGSIFVESSFNPTASGDSWSAFWLCQWRLDRLSSLKKFAKSKWNSKEKRSIQLEFIKHELKWDFAHVLRSMNSTHDIYRKTKIFMNWYEIPNSDSKINHINRRKWFSGAALAEL